MNEYLPSLLGILLVNTYSSLNAWGMQGFIYVEPRLVSLFLFGGSSALIQLHKCPNNVYNFIHARCLHTCNTPVTAYWKRTMSP